MTAVFFGASAPLFLLYLLTLSPTLPLEDGGEMIRAAWSLGVTHMPGYPFYTLVGRLAMLVPAGDPAFRMNLLSALMASLGCGLAAVAALRMVSGPAEPGGRARLLAVLAAWGLGTAPGLWWQAVIAEKYATNLFMNALLLWVLVRGAALKRAPAGWLPLCGLILGLSTSHHGETVFFAPAFLIAGWWGLKRLPAAARPRTVGLAVFMVALGLSVKFVFPPVRAGAHPVHNWGDPSTLERWLAYFSGSAYQHRMFYWGPLDLARRAWEYLSSILPAQFGWLGLAAGGWGAWRMARERPLFAAFTGSAWLAGIFYCINFSLYGIAIRTYYIPTFLVFACWIAYGMHDGLRRAGAARRWGATAALAAAFLWAAWMGVSHRYESDRSRHYFAWDFSRGVLKSVEPDSLLIAYGDYDLFPIWYTHDVAGVNPGVTVVNANFLPAEWARDERKAVELLYPKGAEEWARRAPFIADLLGSDMGHPVWFAVIFGSVEKLDLLPRGLAYRHYSDPRKVAEADVMGEWARWKRWRTLRGVYDAGISRDNNTRSMLSYYAYADYRRGFVLLGQRRRAEAIRLFRSALRWPDFHGSGPAGAHASIGQCLREEGKTAEAMREFEEAARLSPDWTPPLKVLGTMYLDAGRYPEALEAFRKVLKAEPEDAMALQNVRMLENFSGIGKKTQ